MKYDFTLLMIKSKTKVGARGQIVIPKIIRESLGIVENTTLLLELDEKTVRLSPQNGTEIMKRWQGFAKKYGTNASKNIIYGDKLYEEIF